jgi:peptidoglycan/xylan/chitin deacetylase (PgdA/CDA1 family)
LNIGVSRWSPRQLVRRALIALIPRKRLLESAPSSNAIYFTFDDGPHPEHTPRLLDALATHGAKATFFVVGEQCERYPKIVRRMAEEGHAVGNHTYSHLNARVASPSSYLAEVVRTNEIIESIIGRRSSLFRPPHGAINLQILWALWRTNQTIVLWNVDPKDYSVDISTVYRWFHANPIQPGDIILLHDNRAQITDIACALLDQVRAIRASVNHLEQVVGAA